jgi:hypothetical protein
MEYVDVRKGWPSPWQYGHKALHETTRESQVARLPPRLLDAEGIEFFGPVRDSDDGNAWSDFRAPDGRVDELTQQPDHPAHAT